VGDARVWSRGAVAVLVLLLTTSTAPAVSFGSVEVTVESEPKGNATHGYAEVWVRVQNRSEQTAHTVRLTFPKASYSPGTDYLRAVTRTVTVEPGKVARVALAYPERVTVVGTGLGITIDGREQEEAIALGGSSRGFGGYGRSRYSSSSSGPAQPLVLYSRSVDTNFPDWVGEAQRRVLFGGGRPPPGVTVMSGPGLGVECVRADQPAAAWSPNWLGYSRYDGVVVTAEDLRSMPAEVRAAVAQYVECGGSLLVLGPDAPLPGRWKPQPIAANLQLAAGTAGFGDYFVEPGTDLSDWKPDAAARVFNSWSRTLAPWQRNQTPAEAHRSFPVIDDVGVPVKGLLALMFVFVIVIGPLNLFVLARRRRKLWQFWTVPLVSLLTCLGVFGYMAITEGWAGRARAEAFTVLDENSRRAATIGWTGYYTPLLAGTGLHFGAGTEVAYQNGDEHGPYPYSRRQSGASALTIDWTRDQHLASGWITPRVPSHFAVRKGEARRERVTITKGADGRPEAVNGLGADLTELWYADETGALYRAANVPAGGRVTLEPAARPAPPGGVRTLRDVYGGDWPNVVTRMKTDGPALLTPRTYLAVMDAAPFLDDGLPGASVRKARSVVLGILREGGDEG
jgi:hypothetical protein